MRDGLGLRLGLVARLAGCWLRFWTRRLRGGDLWRRYGEIVDHGLYAVDGAGFVSGEGARGFVAGGAGEGGDSSVDGDLDVFAAESAFGTDFGLDVAGDLLVGAGSRLLGGWLVTAAGGGEEHSREAGCGDTRLQVTTRDFHLASRDCECLMVWMVWVQCVDSIDGG